MPIRIARDPRRYLLAVMALSLIIIVPMLFLFITMVGEVLAPDRTFGLIATWVLLGAATVGLLGGMMLLLARATRLTEMEQRARESGGHSMP